MLGSILGPNRWADAVLSLGYVETEAVPGTQLSPRPPDPALLGGQEQSACARYRRSPVKDSVPATLEGVLALL